MLVRSTVDYYIITTTCMSNPFPITFDLGGGNAPDSPAAADSKTPPSLSQACRQRENYGQRFPPLRDGDAKNHTGEEDLAAKVVLGN